MSEHFVVGAGEAVESEVCFIEPGRLGVIVRNLGAAMLEEVVTEAILFALTLRQRLCMNAQDHASSRSSNCAASVSNRNRCRTSERNLHYTFNGALFKTRMGS